MLTSDREYWVELLEKLNSTDDLYTLFGEVLEELCTHFSFGASFIYQADYRGTLYLVGSHSLYNVRLPRALRFKKLLQEKELHQLLETKLISFRKNTTKDTLSNQLAEIFETRSLILVPVVDRHKDLLAVVGILDRRGEVRHKEEDIDFTGAVLSTLATFYKTQLYQHRIESTQKSLEMVLDNMGVDVYVNDFETHEILYANESMAKPYGGKDKLVDEICWKALYTDKTGECDFCPQKQLLDSSGNPTKTYSWDYQRSFDCSWFRVISAAFPWVDGRLAHIVSSVDITDNKRNEEIIRKMAEYDHLTGLPNRFRLTIDFDERIPALEENRQESYVLFLDLDGFKQVNDRWGHDVGDALLKQVGQFLQSSGLTRDQSYRYGGDEFVVLCGPSTPGPIQEVIAYLQEGFAQKWKVGDNAVQCGVSIGISHYPGDSTLSSELLRQADQAMYESKRVGYSQVRFFNRGTICAPGDYAPFGT